MKQRLVEALQGVHYRAAQQLCRRQQWYSRFLEKEEFLQWISEQSLKTQTSFSTAGRSRAGGKALRSREQMLGDPVPAGCLPHSSFPRCCPHGPCHCHPGSVIPSAVSAGREMCLVRSSWTILVLCWLLPGQSVWLCTPLPCAG